MNVRLLAVQDVVHQSMLSSHLPKSLLGCYSMNVRTRWNLIAATEEGLAHSQANVAVIKIVWSRRQSQKVLPLPFPSQLVDLRISVRAGQEDSAQPVIPALYHLAIVTVNATRTEGMCCLRAPVYPRRRLDCRVGHLR